MGCLEVFLSGYLQLTVLFASCGQWALGLTSSPLAEFGELKVLELHDKLTGVPYQLYYVGCLIDDDAFPGHVIVGDGSALMLLDPDRAMDNIAGISRISGYVDDAGEAARFTFVTDVYQKNKNELIVVDHFNHCLRKIERDTRNVTTYLGRCLSPGITEIGAEIARENARLSSPTALLHDKDVLYILNKGAVSVYNETSATLKTFINVGSEVLVDGVFTTDKLKIIMNKNSAGGWAGIWSLSVKTGALKVVEGSMPDYGRSAALNWVIPDQLLAVAGLLSQSIQLVNFVDKRVTTICPKNLTSAAQEVAPGPVGVCAVFYPGALSTIGSTLYIGMINMITTMDFEVVSCDRPVFPETAHHSDLLSRYTHLAKVGFQCDSAYVASHDYVQCVRGETGIKGSWEYPVPFCEERGVHRISPLSGQSAGGTLITVEGILPHTVIVYISHRGTLTEPELLSRSEFALTFRMPTKIESSTSTAYIAVVAINIDDIFYEETFTYLPNPEITRVATNSSIERLAQETQPAAIAL